MQTNVPNIIVTDPAAVYIQKKIQECKGAGFRLSVKKTGCFGYAYVFNIIDQVVPTDMLVEVNAQVKIYLDKEWLSFLQEVHIDYIEEDRSGLKQKRLVCSSPKENGRCGCGDSFHVER